jgi:hypothetical protein
MHQLTKSRTTKNWTNVDPPRIDPRRLPGNSDSDSDREEIDDGAEVECRAGEAEYQFVADNYVHSPSTTSNLLLPKKYLTEFISENF